MQFKKTRKETKTVKIAIWYTISNLFISGITFLSSPLFARMLSKNEYGEFSNFSSWLSILQVVITFNMGATIARAKYDFEDEMNCYLSTLVIFNNITTLIAMFFAETFSAFVEDIFAMDIQYIRFLLLYLFFYPAFSYLQIKHRIFREYKFFVFFSISTAILRTLVSVICVLTMNNKLFGRIAGDIFSICLASSGLWVYILYKGKVFKWNYLKYALTISIPLIPHTLAGNLLMSSDKIMINSMCGPEQNAIYSMAYSVSSIVTLFWTALNQAWAPWLYDNMAIDNKKEIRTKSQIYLGTFAVLIVGILLIAPEVIDIMGGKKYYESRFLMPPVILAGAFQFVYGMYVNIEIFTKKTFQISFGTVVAGVINITLNYMLIPKLGYQVASYTTLTGYILLFAFHFYMVRKGGQFTDIYNTRFIFMILLTLSVSGLLLLLTYYHDVTRHLLLAIYLVILGIVVSKNRKQILSMIK